MAKVPPLTDSAVRTAKFNPDDAKLNTRRDGQGLELRITATSKSWLFKYYRPADSKRTNISFGQYPDVTLAMARERRQEARSLLAQGVDPQRHRDEQAAAQRAGAANTFGAVFEQLMELKSHEAGAQHCHDIRRRFELHILPTLAQTPIADVRAPAVIAMLRPLEASGTLDTLSRCCSQLNEVMDYAVNYGLIDANPCAKIIKVFKSPVRNKMPTLPPEGIIELLATLAGSRMDATTERLARWQLHTLVRPGEAAGTRWDEIDLEKRVWTIPADRMNMGKPHRVPLTDEAIAILDLIRPWSGLREHVFPGRSNPRTHANPSAVNQVLKRSRLAGQQSAHGFRALGSTTLNEQGFTPDVIEAALAHEDGNKVRAAYNRSDYLEERREMMAWWSDHIEQARKGVYTVREKARPDLRVVEGREKVA